jgi:hypothetical protein
VLLINLLDADAEVVGPEKKRVGVQERLASCSLWFGNAPVYYFSIRLGQCAVVLKISFSGICFL